MKETPNKRRLREERFVAEYLKDLNATEAMRRCGFLGRRPDVAASKLLARPTVTALVQARSSALLQRADATAERIIQETAAIAYSDPRHYFDQHGNLIPVRQLSDHAAAAVSDLEFENVVVGAGKQARIMPCLKKLKRWNKNEGLKLLAQIRGLTQPDRPAPVSVFNIQINL